MNLINELLNCLKSIDYNCYSEEYVNALLEHRDCEPFDTEWSRDAWLDWLIQEYRRGKISAWQDD